MANEYQRDIAIDPDNLEEEFLQQPSLYFKYSDLRREAGEDRDKAKDQLELWKAQTSLAIRSNPDQYGLAKATNDAVSEKLTSILNDKENTGHDVKERYDEALYRFNIYSNVLASLDQKKKSLEMLVQLHVSNWFSGPAEPKTVPGGKRIVDIHSGDVSNKVRQATKTRTRRRR